MREPANMKTIEEKGDKLSWISDFGAICWLVGSTVIRRSFRGK